MMLIQGDVKRIPLPDESIDLIFTDPPYGKEYLFVFEELAKEAMRILKPGAFILIMCGGTYLNQIFSTLDKSGLNYFWKYEFYLTGKGGGFLWPRGNTKVPIISRSKPILAYSKDNGLPRTGTLSVFTSNGADKRYHHWGQDVGSARYFIDCFSKKGDLILDPMVGGGTTLIAAELIERKYIGLDIDFKSCQTSKRRLVESDVLHNLPLFESL